ncbi:hypothetical protein [Pseudomonas sp. RIT288]|uniref:hypothetical protein n=1 Tax=Pseudomonas sp. RIT288 TaxID=1470589 RepID=UPI00044D59D0|nr:hypothetical protein [Pseudomonas sp. RIT288]EZP25883.1 hypothetical protein BW33_05310 [Pseudomonas sp. RIT288]
MNDKTNEQHMSAVIQGTHPHTFEANSDWAIDKVENQFWITAVHDENKDEQERQKGKPWHFITLRVPGTLSNDGTEDILEIGGNTEAIYARFSDSGGPVHPARSGEIKIRYDWKTARMYGEYRFKIGGFGEELDIIDGRFDLTGITDSVQNNQSEATGTFTANGGIGDFKADKFRITKHQPSPIIPSYLEVRAEQSSGSQVRYTIFIMGDLKAGEFDLSKKDEVYIVHNSSTGELHITTSGKLIFTAAPTERLITGTFDAQFSDSFGNEVDANGKFNIEA